MPNELRRRRDRWSIIGALPWVLIGLIDTRTTSRASSIWRPCCSTIIGVIGRMMHAKFFRVFDHLQVKIRKPYKRKCHSWTQSSITHTVKWTPSGGTQQEGVLSYGGEQPTGQTFIYVLDHDVAAASFSDWEELDYEFFIADVLQAPSVAVSLTPWDIRSHLLERWGS